MAGQAIAVWYWPPSYTEIVPQNPTSFDIVAITLGGEWGDSCIPNVSNISVIGNNIYFDVIRDYPSPVCLTIIMPWELTESVGPLSPGMYSVYARLDWGPYIWMTNFIVSGNPDIYEDGCVNLFDFAIFAQAWMTQPGDNSWNPACNIAEPNDNTINEQDLAVLTDNWLRCEPP
jgi:hypothetical protein